MNSQQPRATQPELNKLGQLSNALGDHGANVSQLILAQMAVQAEQERKSVPPRA